MKPFSIAPRMKLWGVSNIVNKFTNLFKARDFNTLILKIMDNLNLLYNLTYLLSKFK